MKTKTSKSKKTKKSACPMTCTLNQLCDFKYDHVDVGDFTLMTDSYSVWLSEQKMGEPVSQKIAMSRKVFNRLLKWYCSYHPLISKNEQ